MCVSIAFYFSNNRVRCARLLRVIDHCLITFSELKTARNTFLFSVGCDMAVCHEKTPDNALDIGFITGYNKYYRGISEFIPIA